VIVGHRRMGVAYSRLQLRSRAVRLAAVRQLEAYEHAATPGRGQRIARLIADTTALSEAFTIDESTPTPQNTVSSTAHST
jgi:hypothetical protein